MSCRRGHSRGDSPAAGAEAVHGDTLALTAWRCRRCCLCGRADTGGCHSFWGKAAPCPSAGSVDFGPDVTSSDKSIKVLLNAQDKVSAPMGPLCPSGTRRWLTRTVPSLSLGRRPGTAGPWGTGQDRLGFRDRDTGTAGELSSCSHSPRMRGLSCWPINVWGTDPLRGTPPHLAPVQAPGERQLRVLRCRGWRCRGGCSAPAAVGSAGLQPDP